MNVHFIFLIYNNTCTQTITKQVTLVQTIRAEFIAEGKKVFASVCVMYGPY